MQRREEDFQANLAALEKELTEAAQEKLSLALAVRAS